MTQLVIGSVLDWMLDVDHLRIETERTRLHRDRFAELGRRDHHRGEAVHFEIGDVMHTARRARSSIRKRLDQRMASLPDFPPQICGRRLRVGGFTKSLDGQTALLK